MRRTPDHARNYNHIDPIFQKLELSCRNFLPINSRSMDSWRKKIKLAQNIEPIDVTVTYIFSFITTTDKLISLDQIYS